MLEIDALAIILKMANYMICVYLHSIGVHILMQINVIEWQGKFGLSYTSKVQQYSAFPILTYKALPGLYLS